MSLTFLGVAEHLPIGNSKRIPFFSLVACMTFDLLNKLSLPQPIVLALLHFQFSPLPHLGRVSEQLGCAELPAGVKSQQLFFHIYSLEGLQIKLVISTFWNYVFHVLKNCILSQKSYFKINKNKTLYHHHQCVPRPCSDLITIVQMNRYKSKKKCWLWKFEKNT